MGQSILQKLQTYITAELSDAALYRELARVAPDDAASRIFLEFADNEQSHADQFNRIYYHMTGQKFTPMILPVTLPDNYREFLRERILDESKDFRKYAEQYQLTKSQALKNAYYRAEIDENVHALRLLYLLSA